MRWLTIFYFTVDKTLCKYIIFIYTGWNFMVCCNTQLFNFFFNTSKNAPMLVYCWKRSSNCQSVPRRASPIPQDVGDFIKNPVSILFSLMFSRFPNHLNVFFFHFSYNTLWLRSDPCISPALMPGTISMIVPHWIHFCSL